MVCVEVPVAVVDSVCDSEFVVGVGCCVNESLVLDTIGSIMAMDRRSKVTSESLVET